MFEIVSPLNNCFDVSFWPWLSVSTFSYPFHDVFLIKFYYVYLQQDRRQHTFAHACTRTYRLLREISTKHFTLIQTSDTLSSPPPPHPLLPSILPSRHNRSKLICKILIWGARGWGWGAHDCGRILIRTGRSSSLLYTLRSSYLHNWLMFLCEVGMNNTLVGLLHPQADEKMFNFSKCSAPSLFLSLSFSLSSYLWVLECVCEFSLVSPSLEECCWFAFFVFTVGLKRMLRSITNKRRHLHLQTRMNKLVKWAQYCSINWYNWKSCVTLQAVCPQKRRKKKTTPLDIFAHVTMHWEHKLLHYPSVIRKACKWATWWGTSSLSSSMERCREGDICQLLWLAQPDST